MRSAYHPNIQNPWLFVNVFHNEDFTSEVRAMTADQIEARPWRAVWVDMRKPARDYIENLIADCDNMTDAQAAAEQWIHDQKGKFQP